MNTSVCQVIPLTGTPGTLRNAIKIHVRDCLVMCEMPDVQASRVWGERDITFVFSAVIICLVVYHLLSSRQNQDGTCPSRLVTILVQQNSVK